MPRVLVLQLFSIPHFSPFPRALSSFLPIRSRQQFLQDFRALLYIKSHSLRSISAEIHLSREFIIPLSPEFLTASASLTKTVRPRTVPAETLVERKLLPTIMQLQVI